MDKYKATITLAEKLAPHLGRLVVSDEYQQKKLLNKAKHAYVVGNPIDVGIYRDSSKIIYTKIDAKNDYIGSSNIEKVIDKFIPAGTNYLFSSQKTMLSDCRLIFNLTPYAVIGDKELDSVKRVFYKSHDIDTREAISSLGIKDFFELYHAYLYDNKKFQSLFCNDFETFKAETLEFLQSRTYDGSSETRTEAFEDKFRIDKFNSQLRDFGIKFVFPSTKTAAWIKKREIDLLAYLLKDNIPPIDKDPLNLEFLKFVFEIPYEDQNLELNKTLFKNFGKFLDLDLIMMKEYSNGKHFKEYFDLLSEQKRKDIVHIVKQSSVQNSDINHYLWMTGSKDIRLDYLKLYKEDAEGFIDYFTSRYLEEKKVILKDVMECDHINNKVTEWLNENEADLIREVSFNG